MRTTPILLPQVDAALLGFRVKSGRAIAVLLGAAGSGDPRRATSVQVLDRREIDLCDPVIPQSRQPYHAKMGTLQTDEAIIKRLRGVVVQAAEQSVSLLLSDCRALGPPVRAAGLVVGSLTDPASISNPHIRAHALEGQLFRTALEEALRTMGLPCAVFVERKIYAEAAKTLNRSEEDLKRLLAGLGREKRGPWRSDEKLAALGAWLTLHEIQNKDAE
jgi:hypothetical protein